MLNIFLLTTVQYFVTKNKSLFGSLFNNTKEMLKQKNIFNFMILLISSVQCDHRPVSNRDNEPAVRGPGKTEGFSGQYKELDLTQPNNDQIYIDNDKFKFIGYKGFDVIDSNPAEAEDIDPNYYPKSDDGKAEEESNQEYAGDHRPVSNRDNEPAVREPGKMEGFFGKYKELDLTQPNKDQIYIDNNKFKLSGYKGFDVKPETKNNCDRDSKLHSNDNDTTETRDIVPTADSNDDEEEDPGYDDQVTGYEGTVSNVVDDPAVRRHGKIEDLPVKYKNSDLINPKEGSTYVDKVEYKLRGYKSFEVEPEIQDIYQDSYSNFYPIYVEAVPDVGRGYADVEPEIFNPNPDHVYKYQRVYLI